MIGTFPPDPEFVSTKDAARLYGCSLTYFRQLMQKHRVEPVRTYIGKRLEYLWHPAVVLQFRAARAADRRKKQVWKMERESQRRAQDGRMRARQTRLEHERRKILARIAQRKEARSA